MQYTGVLRRALRQLGCNRHRHRLAEWSETLVAILVAFGAAGGGKLSVSGSAARGASAPVSWVAALAFATNTTQTRLGQMRTDWWSAGLGLDFRDSGLPELAVGPRLGLSYVSAAPELASSASGPGTDALMVLWGAGAELGLPLAGSWLLRGTLDVEQPFRGLLLTAGGERTLSLEGWLLTSGLGLAFRP